MKYSGFKASLAVITAAFLMAGCIPVKNVEKAWQTAHADQGLVGFWAQEANEDEIIGFVKTDKGFLVTSGTSGLEGGCKSFTTNGHSYVIIAQLRAAILGFDKVKADNKDGVLLRYKLEGDSLTLYTLELEIIEAAIRNKQVVGEKNEEGTDTIRELDAAVIRWLGKIADDEAGWDAQSYTRQAG